jgi:hypothetical protein
MLATATCSSRVLGIAEDLLRQKAVNARRRVTDAEVSCTSPIKNWFLTLSQRW